MSTRQEDYLALEANKNSNEHGLGDAKKEDLKAISGVESQVIKEILIPEIEREVNEGKTFTQLRQIYNAVILATWYKQALKESLLGRVYIDQAKTKGVEHSDPMINQKIYNQYVTAFQKGVYDYMKEDYDAENQEIITQKYFSGGANLELINGVGRNETASAVMLGEVLEKGRVVTTGLHSDAAMQAASTTDAMLELSQYAEAWMGLNPKNLQNKWGEFYSSSARKIIGRLVESGLLGDVPYQKIGNIFMSLSEYMSFSGNEEFLSSQVFELIKQYNLSKDEENAVVQMLQVYDQQLKVPKKKSFDILEMLPKIVISILLEYSGYLKDPKEFNQKLEESKKLIEKTRQAALLRMSKIVKADSAQSASSDAAMLELSQYTEAWLGLNPNNYKGPLGEFYSSSVREIIGSLDELELTGEDSYNRIGELFDDLSKKIPYFYPEKSIRRILRKYDSEIEKEAIIKMIIVFNNQEAHSGSSIDLTAQLVQSILVGYSAYLKDPKEFEEMLDESKRQIDAARRVALLKDSKQRTDAAMLPQDVGGIDMNPAMLNMKKDREGKGVVIPLPLEPTGNWNNVEGFTPFIINVLPITNLPLLLGIKNSDTEHKTPETQVSYNISLLATDPRQKAVAE